MSTDLATVDEPTTDEAANASKFAHVFDTPDDAPGTALAPAPAPAHHDRHGKWRLPRLSTQMYPDGWSNWILHVGIDRASGRLTLEVRAETELSGTRLVAEWRSTLMDRLHFDATNALLDTPEYKSAADVLPRHADAERRLRAARSKLDGIAAKKAKRTASPKPGLGKALLEIGADEAAIEAEVRECGAEVGALAPLAASARFALEAAAVETCKRAKRDFGDTRTALLKEKTAAFLEAHSEELTELALLSAGTAPERPPNASAIVATMVADLTSERDAADPVEA